MSLISLKSLVDAAKARGFKANGGNSYVELFAPDHEGSQAVQWYDSQYSTCTVSLCDRPRSGYGYNGWFNGPWHDGLVQSDDSSVRKLLAHPAMKGFSAG